MREGLKTMFTLCQLSWLIQRGAWTRVGRGPLRTLQPRDLFGLPITARALPPSLCRLTIAVIAGLGGPIRVRSLYRLHRLHVHRLHAPLPPKVSPIVPQNLDCLRSNQHCNRKLRLRLSSYHNPTLNPLASSASPDSLPCATITKTPPPPRPCP